jgi:WD40 repeat protein/serine/threonine protein kinase
MPRIDAKPEGDGEIAGQSNGSGSRRSVVAGESSCSIDSVSSRDVEECVRLLDEVWPQNETAEDCPKEFGRFSIVRELGRGGFGVVFLAEDPILGRRVALKVPKIDVLADSQSWRRFLREARTASRLDHTNLVPLLEAGAVGPVGYIASAFVEGPTLDQCLRHARSGAPARFSARLIATLAGALEHMHERGVLHRDLKPANILMQAPDRTVEPRERMPWDDPGAESWIPRICDFGLAKLREIGVDETRSRSAAGSPPYMSPEQAEARHDDIGPATDVYGLGATLYQLLTGRPPFSGSGELETLRRVVADEPVRPRQLRPDLPRDLETICLKCLAKRPEPRYGSAAALADDLERFLEGRPVLASPVPAWERGWKWARRHPALAALATATTLAVLAGASGLIWHESLLRSVNEKLRGSNEQLEKVNEQLRLAGVEKDKSSALVSRQLAIHQIFGAQQALDAKNFDLAHRQLDAAEGSLGNFATQGFACSFLRKSFRDRLQLLAGHGGVVDSIVAAPDGRTLASTDDRRELRLWDLDTGRSHLLEPHSSRSYDWLIFSPDGRTLASIEDIGLITIWEVSTGRRRGQLQHSGTGRVRLSFFTPDGRFLAAAQDAPAPFPDLYWWWDISHESGVFPRSSSDHRMPHALTPLDDRLTCLADVIDGGPAPGLRDFQQSWIRNPPKGVSLTRDRRLAVTGLGDGTFVVQPFHIGGWNFLAGRIQPCGTSIVLKDASRWSWTIAAPARDSSRLERLARLLIPASPRQHSDGDLLVLGRNHDLAAYSKDGRTLATWRDGESSLNLIDLTNFRQVRAYDRGQIGGVTSMDFTPDGATLAIGCSDHLIRLWRFRTQPQPMVLSGHAPKETWALAFAPDGRTLASAGDDHQVRLWDLESGRVKAALTRHHSLVTSLAYSPDGRTLASGSYDVFRPIVVWDPERLTRRVEPTAPTRRISAVAFSPDGISLAAGGADMMVRLWDVESGRLNQTIATHSLGISSLVFSPDGRMLASAGGDSRIALTDTETGKSRTMNVPNGCFALVFSPDGSRLYSAHSGGSILTWDTEKRAEMVPFAGHNGEVRCLTVTPDGTSLASGGDDRTVRVWDTVTGQELLCLTDCKARVNAVAFSPDGMTLAAADHSGAITIWNAGARTPAPATNSHGQSPAFQPLASAGGVR